MTCIVGIEHNGSVYIGGDSAGIDLTSLRKDSITGEKVFFNRRCNKMLIGFTLSFRMGQLLRYSYVPKTHEKGRNTYEYLVNDFVDSVRDCFRRGGIMHNTDGRELGGQFLLGYHGNLYTIHSDFQVAHSACGYAAIGAGVDLALGSLYTTSKVVMDPVSRIKIALDAASKFNAGVEGPYTILELKGCK